MTDSFTLWFRQTARHAWRPVAPPGSYRDAIDLLADGGGRHHGDWIILAAGVKPDGRTGENPDLFTTEAHA